VLSIAAGVTIKTLEAACGSGIAVIRSMPNTPALVGEGASAIAGGAHANEVDIAWAEAVLGSVGLVVRVPESQLDVVTGLAGSGPAYLFLVAEALMDAGVASGLPRATAEILVRQLFVGSAKLLAEGQAPADLRASVTSPGGTTAAGVAVLETEAVRAAFIQAVTAATDRSRELGNR
jgi:pyrroline-5-carboxylate reductase